MKRNMDNTVCFSDSEAEAASWWGRAHTFLIPPSRMAAPLQLVNSEVCLSTTGNAGGSRRGGAGWPTWAGGWSPQPLLLQFHRLLNRPFSPQNNGTSSGAFPACDFTALLEATVELLLGPLESVAGTVVPLTSAPSVFQILLGIDAWSKNRMLLLMWKEDRNLLLNTLSSKINGLCPYTTE